MADRSQTTLSARERIALEYLSPLMEAHASEIGRRLWEACPGKGGNLTSLGAAVCGRLRRRGLVLRIDDLNQWRISQAGREALHV